MKWKKKCKIWLAKKSLKMVIFQQELLKSDSNHPKKKQKKAFYFLQWSPFKNDEKCFLYHLKSSFRSQDIYIFVMTFWSYRKSSLIRKISLTEKFMTPLPGSQTIAIHILPNTLWSRANQTMKLGQLLEYNKKNTFFHKLCGKQGREFHYVLIALNLAYNKKQTI